MYIYGALDSSDRSRPPTQLGCRARLVKGTGGPPSRPLRLGYEQLIHSQIYPDVTVRACFRIGIDCS